tara:strand:- start:139 stop:375 length:237 start_codon:yes stop_codon:yes gene_type:complete
MKKQVLLSPAPTRAAAHAAANLKSGFNRSYDAYVASGLLDQQWTDAWKTHGWADGDASSSVAARLAAVESFMAEAQGL